MNLPLLSHLTKYHSNLIHSRERPNTLPLRCIPSSVRQSLVGFTPDDQKVLAMMRKITFQVETLHQNLCFHLAVRGKNWNVLIRRVSAFKYLKLPQVVSTMNWGRVALGKYSRVGLMEKQLVPTPAKALPLLLKDLIMEEQGAIRTGMCMILVFMLDMTMEGTLNGLNSTLGPLTVFCIPIQREVEYLGRLYHPNLVRLYGHCSGGSSSCLLSWTLRMKIALGAARGLAFLHSNKINVIHRGFKSSDILLDSDYNAKLSDFGLAMDGFAGDIPTGVFGTPGYVAPEYIATGRLSTKSDVYSFGVVLLEILSGRRIIEHSMHSCQYNLVHWANVSLSHEEKVFRVLDQCLEGQYSMESAQIAVMLALLCVAMEAEARPNMDEVVTILEGLQDQPNPSDQETLE